MADTTTPRNRLPTLFEVLADTTFPPVDVESFRRYLQTENSEEYFEFWSDVRRHITLCRVYVRELRLIDSARQSVDISVSNHLDTDSWNQSPPRFDVEVVPEPNATEKVYNPKIRETTRSEITHSALNIYNKYIRPGSEKELRIPPRMARTFQLAAQRNIEEQGRNDPEVFDEVKDYIYQTMESLYYPNWLRQAALGNLTVNGKRFRLALGLLCSLGGLCAALTLIGLYETQRTRLWVIIPFAIGSYCLVGQEYGVDPVLAIAGFSEKSLLSPIRNREPYVRLLLMKRAWASLFIICFFIAVFSVVFIFIPVKPI